MKTLKFILLFNFIAISSILCFSQQVDKGKIKNAANDYVNKLAIDVQMTDNQKISLKESVINYFTEMTIVKTIIDKDKQKSIIENAEKIFTQKTDSILTTEQRETVRFKSNQRAETASNKNNPKQNK